MQAHRAALGEARIDFFYGEDGAEVFRIDRIDRIESGGSGGVMWRQTDCCARGSDKAGRTTKTGITASSTSANECGDGQMVRIERIV